MADVLIIRTSDHARQADAWETEERGPDGRWESSGGALTGAQVYALIGAINIQTASMRTLDEKMQAKVEAQVEHRLGVKPDEVLANYRTMFDRARERGDTYDAGMHWYQNVHDRAAEQAERNGNNIENVAGAYAAMSPGGTWDAEPSIIESMLTLDQGTVRLSDDALAALNVKLERDGQDPVHNGDSYRDLGIRAAVMTMQAQHMTEGAGTAHTAETAWGVGYSWQNYEKSLDILRNDNVNGTLLGVKVREFYNNIANPQLPGHVTIDVDMMRAAAQNAAIKNDSVVTGTPSFSMKIDGETYKTSVGPTPLLADAVRTIAQENGILPQQAQAIIWSQWLAQQYEAGHGGVRGKPKTSAAASTAKPKEITPYLGVEPTPKPSPAWRKAFDEATSMAEIKAALAMKARQAYSQDQPRGEDGRFSSGAEDLPTANARVSAYADQFAESHNLTPGTPEATDRASWVWASTFAGSTGTQDAADALLGHDADWPWSVGTSISDASEYAFAARELLDSISNPNAPDHIDNGNIGAAPLYRGINDPTGEIAKEFVEGSTVEFGLAAFTGNLDTAERFSAGQLGVTPSTDASAPQVLIVTQGDWQAANVGKNIGTQEVVTGGKFNVVSVEHTTVQGDPYKPPDLPPAYGGRGDGAPLTVVTVEQTAPPHVKAAAAGAVHWIPSRKLGPSMSIGQTKKRARAAKQAYPGQPRESGRFAEGKQDEDGKGSGRVSTVALLNKTPDDGESHLSLYHGLAARDPELVQAVSDWSEDSHYIAQAADALLAGREPANREEPGQKQRDVADARTLLDGVAKSPPTEDALYRGLRITPDHYDEARAEFAVGNHVDVALGSFSRDMVEAQKWASGNYGVQMSNTFPILMRMEPGAQALHLAPISEWPTEEEWVSSGRLTVADSQPYVDYAGNEGIQVTMRYDAALGSAKAAAVTVAYERPPQWLVDVLNTSFADAHTPKKQASITVDGVKLGYSEDQPRGADGRFEGGASYGFEVQYAKTHDDMQAGKYEASYVTVHAKDSTEAHLLASQMVGHKGIPVGTKLIKDPSKPPPTLKQWAAEHPRGTLYRAMERERLDQARESGTLRGGHPDEVWVSQVAKTEYLDRLRDPVVVAIQPQPGDVKGSGAPGDLKMHEVPVTRVIDEWSPPKPEHASETQQVGGPMGGSNRDLLVDTHRVYDTGRESQPANTFGRKYGSVTVDGVKLADWNPDDHPRGPDGRFGEGDSGKEPAHEGHQKAEDTRQQLEYQITGRLEQDEMPGHNGNVASEMKHANAENVAYAMRLTNAQLDRPLDDRFTIQNRVDLVATTTQQMTEINTIGGDLHMWGPGTGSGRDAAPFGKDEPLTAREYGQLVNLEHELWYSEGGWTPPIGEVTNIMDGSVRDYVEKAGEQGRDITTEQAMSEMWGTPRAFIEAAAEAVSQVKGDDWFPDAKTGLAEHFTDLWAGTASDHSVYASAMQEVAAREFGGNIGNLRDFNSSIGERQFIPDPNGPGTIVPTGVSMQQDVNTVVKTEGDIMAAYLHAAQQVTHDGLGLKPDDTIHVYRGISSNQEIPAGSPIAVNPLSSWTVSLGTARGFGNYVVQADVPASAIVGSPFGGPGALNEYEVVLNVPVGTETVTQPQDEGVDAFTAPIGYDSEPMPDTPDAVKLGAVSVKGLWIDEWPSADWPKKGTDDTFETRKTEAATRSPKPKTAEAWETEERGPDGRWTSGGTPEVDQERNAAENRQTIERDFNSHPRTPEERGAIKAATAQALADRMRDRVPAEFMRGTAVSNVAPYRSTSEINDTLHSAFFHNENSALSAPKMADVVLRTADRESYGKLVDLNYHLMSDTYGRFRADVQTAANEYIGRLPSGIDFNARDFLDYVRERTGFEADPMRGYAASYLQRWQESSADTHLGSMSIQLAAGRVFGGDTSYIRDRIDEYAGKPVTTQTIFTPTGGEIGPRALDKDEAPLTEAFLRASYDQTQAYFAGLGLKPDDLVQVHRGVGPEELVTTPAGPGPVMPEERMYGVLEGVAVNPLSSWSVSQGDASMFGGGGVVTSYVPVSAIVGSALTGDGAIIENEVILSAPQGGYQARYAAVKAKKDWPYVDKPPFDDWIKTKHAHPLDEHPIFPLPKPKRHASVTVDGHPVRQAYEGQPREHGRFAEGKLDEAGKMRQTREREMKAIKDRADAKLHEPEHARAYQVQLERARVASETAKWEATRGEVKPEVRAAEARIRSVIDPDGLSPARYVDLKDVAPKLATEVADRVEAFQKDTGIADRIDSISMYPTYGSTSWIAQTSYGEAGTASIQLASTYYSEKTSFGGPSYFETVSQKAYDEGFHVSPSTASAMDHELGHVLDHALSTPLIPQTMEYSSPVAGEGTHMSTYGTVSTWSSDNSQFHNGQSLQTVSGYAYQNEREGFAEAYAAHVAGMVHDDPAARQLDTVISYAVQDAHNIPSTSALTAAAAPKPAATCVGYVPDSIAKAAAEELGLPWPPPKRVAYPDQPREHGQFSFGKQDEQPAPSHARELIDNRHQIEKATDGAQVLIGRLDPAAATVLAERLTNFEQQFPGAAHSIASVTAGEMTDESAGTAAYIAPNGDGTYDMVINADAFAPGGMIEQLQGSNDSGHRDELTNAGAILDHELGHVLDFHVQDATNDVVCADCMIQQYVAGPNVSDETGNQRIGDVVDVLGSYVATNQFEMFAEAYTAQQHGLGDELPGWLQDVVMQTMGSGHSAAVNPKQLDAWRRTQRPTKTCGGFFPKPKPKQAYSEDQPRDADGRFGTGDGAARPEFDASHQAPVQSLLDGKAAYTEGHGLGTPAERDWQAITRDPEAGAQTAHDYDALPMYNGPATEAAYAAMRDEVGQQFEYLTNTLGVKVDVVDHDPYPDVKAMRDDVANNGHLAVLATASTGGHPYFTNEQNDQFRAVHDAFGHAAIGRGFDRNGEEAAFQSHAQMFSPAATAALATETRGQNSVLVYGGKGEFPPQKFALLPAQDTQPVRQSAAGKTTRADADADNQYGYTRCHHTSCGRSLHNARPQGVGSHRGQAEAEADPDHAAAGPEGRSGVGRVGGAGVRGARIAVDGELVHRAYSESQPRDSHGRFGEGTGTKAPSEASVKGVLADWVFNGGKAAEIRKAADDLDAHANIWKGSQEVKDAQVLMAKAEASKPIEDTIYRGITVKGTAEDAARQFEAGAPVHIGLASFSRDEWEAQKFGQWGIEDFGGFAEKGANGSDYTQINFVIDSGARGVDVNEVGPRGGAGIFASEKEVIARGDYTVTSAEQTMHGNYYALGTGRLPTQEAAYPPVPVLEVHLAPADQKAAAVDRPIVLSIPAFSEVRKPDPKRAYPGQPREGGRFAEGKENETTGAGNVAHSSIIDKIAKEGGISIQPVSGKLPEHGFMVAHGNGGVIHKAAEFFKDKATGKGMLKDFVRSQAAFFKGGGFLGAWFDHDHGEVALDKVENIADRDAAIALGREHDQQAIYDLDAKVDIPTGGTGGRQARAGPRIRIVE